MTVTEQSSQETSRPIARSVSLRTGLSGVLVVIAAVLVLLIAVYVILILLGKDPGAAAAQFVRSALGTPGARADVIMAAVPLLLCASGLLVTFTAGLWNIGIEGQIVFGAVFATFIALGATPESNPLVIIPLELIFGAIGGALWAAIVGILKIKGGINEIFGGVALNFIATNIVLALINGPWKAGNTPQTKVFESSALLPRLPDLRISIPAILIAIVAFIIVFVLLRGTRWGLQLKAMGKNAKSAFVLGVRTERNTLWALMLCGALAGLAGAIQATFAYQKLIPNIGGGIGFLAVLMVLLTNVQPTLIPVVTLFFAVVPVGNLKLASAINESVRLETSLGNAFQSGLVLLVLLFGGVRDRLRGR